MMATDFTPAPFLLAMARMEGWLHPAARCRRNHNPGNIEAGRFSVAHGAIRSDGRFAVFPDDETGFTAMTALLSGPVYAGLTISEAIAKWAPPNENDTLMYTALVCSWANCKPTDLLASVLAT
jgi:hypothetical protein